MENLSIGENLPKPMSKSLLVLALIVEIIPLSIILTFIALYNTRGLENLLNNILFILITSLIISTIIVTIIGMGLFQEKKWGLYTFSVLTIIQICCMSLWTIRLMGDDYPRESAIVFFIFFIFIEIITLVWTLKARRRFV